MDLGIAGRVALVTAASSGLGRAMAVALAAEGVNVAVTGRDEERLAATVAACAEHGVSALALAWDLADHGRAAEVAAHVARDLGPVDILVNNTGGPPPTPALGQDIGLWQDHYASMVLPVIALTDAVVPGMRERGWGRIITSTSSGAIAPIPNLGISNTLRASLHSWSKTLAREVAADGVTANVIVPGRVATPRTDSLDRARAEREGRTVAEVEADARATIPAGRYGRPEEYGAVAAFLSSRQAAYVTGTAVRVDGGHLPTA
ncbi:SDR family oxidoreductase [Nocardiopsis aegyptia]|uniref:3-oxoacyl-[acyl-carrier protein] reductase n=1 Tax=Nocardiopsis aegyptia TaxID=220378 RepID=A0A7Z0EJD2_9ACTN|nr:SDR family oxidoreductase [Nocardiopsis aegyptia]NYJ33149.1 3-oxoacyl-[acyl-carrier protein] reductase [Nocardiopsis aegyptia]